MQIGIHLGVFQHYLAGSVPDIPVNRIHVAQYDLTRKKTFLSCISELLSAL